MRQISAGSYSRLADFQECKKRAFLKYVEKVPEPERPPLPEGQEYPNDRGTRVHNEGDSYVKGVSDTIGPEWRYFRPEVDRARELYRQGKVIPEELWCFDADWNVVGPTAWGQIKWRVKIDLFVFLDDTTALVVDYKTGRKIGNERKHSEQVQSYAAAVFARFPEITTAIIELWYLDQDHLTSATIRRDMAPTIQNHWRKKLITMLECRSFPAHPNKEICKWCPYKGTEHCDEGVIV